MKYIALLALILSSTANAQTCVGPAPCGPQFGPGGGYMEPVGPAELCLPDGCNPVSYYVYNRFTVAESTLPNGFPVMGWAGPCDQDFCVDIKNQAFADLLTSAKRANRAQRY